MEGQGENGDNRFAFLHSVLCRNRFWRDILTKFKTHAIRDKLIVINIQIHWYSISCKQKNIYILF